MRTHYSNMHPTDSWTPSRAFQHMMTQSQTQGNNQEPAAHLPRSRGRM